MAFVIYCGEVCIFDYHSYYNEWRCILLLLVFGLAPLPHDTLRSSIGWAEVQIRNNHGWIDDFRPAVPLACSTFPRHKSEKGTHIIAFAWRCIVILGNEWWAWNRSKAYYYYDQISRSKSSPSPLLLPTKMLSSNTQIRFSNTATGCTIGPIIFHLTYFGWIFEGRECSCRVPMDDINHIPNIEFRLLFDYS